MINRGDINLWTAAPAEDKLYYSLEWIYIYVQVYIWVLSYLLSYLSYLTLIKCNVGQKVK